jgi:hypothetical protein
MRRTPILLALLAAATPVFAQPDARWRASVFGVQHGFGAAIAYAPARAWDIEVAVAQQQYHWLSSTVGASPGNFSGPAFPVTIDHRYDAVPVDLFVTRHFADDARVSPYLRVGGRSVSGRGPFIRTIFIDNVYPLTEPVYGRRTSAEAGAGARLRLTSHLALRVEAVRLLRSDEAVFDPLRRASAGLSWQF